MARSSVTQYILSCTQTGITLLLAIKMMALPGFWPQEVQPQNPLEPVIF